MEKTKKKSIQENLDENEELNFGSIEDQKKKIKDRFFDACKKGNVETIEKLFQSELFEILDVDDNKWSGLQWAVVNNHPEVVKILYLKVKEAEEMQLKIKNQKESSENRVHELNEFDEAFKKPLNPADNGKYTPLHWSAYKGFDVISSILIKMGCDPMSVDSYGDNSLHQAAAGNNYNTFKLFMGLGIDLNYKNSRSHKAIDLTTNKNIQNLIEKALSIKTCQICNKIFDFNNRRYLCSIKEEIICKGCAVIDYYYDSEEAPEKDIRDCRCKFCQEEITKAEKDLQAAIDSNNLEKLTTQFIESQKYKIDLHLKKNARLNENRLFREKQITELLDSLKVVESYKTIFKSVEDLDQKIASAEENNVKLDPKILERKELDKHRLLAERELRHLLSGLDISKASQKNLDDLKQVVETSTKCNVADCYVSIGKELMDKFVKNLAAKDIMDKLNSYPIREYPEEEEVDPKKKKKAEPPKKKKKKKEDKFDTPEWAKDLKDLIARVDELKKYVKVYKDIGLDDAFLKNAKEQLQRFNKEIPFRREEEEALKKLEEEKNAKKNKGKKK